MTPEELLKPRYRVITDYPGNTFEMGTILIQDLDTVGEVWVQASRVSEKNTDRDFMLPDYVDKYPHLLRRLSWWEERKVEDMPEYVKVNTNNTSLFLGDILKVRMWNVRPAGHLYCWVEEDKAKSFPDMFKYSPDVFLPTT